MKIKYYYLYMKKRVYKISNQFLNGLNLRMAAPVGGYLAETITRLDFKLHKILNVQKS